MIGVLEAVQRLVEELTVVLSSLDHGNTTQLPQQVNSTITLSPIYRYSCMVERKLLEMVTPLGKSILKWWFYCHHLYSMMFHVGITWSVSSSSCLQ